MSWNYMQPNAGLLQYAGAGMNNLGKGLLGMSQQVQEMPYHQKRLGLLDAQRNATNNQGLLYRAKAQGENIENAYKPGLLDAQRRETIYRGGLLKSQAQNTDANTAGINIDNQSRNAKNWANINHTNAQTQLNSQALHEQMATEDARAKQLGLDNLIKQFGIAQGKIGIYAQAYPQTLSPKDLERFNALTPEQREQEANAFAHQRAIQELSQSQTNHTPAYYSQNPPQPGLLNMPIAKHFWGLLGRGGNQ